MDQLLSFRDALEKNGFHTQVFSSGAEAAAWILAQIPQNATIGVGGSVTIQQLGIADALRDSGHTVYWHWYKPGPETLHYANNADVYLCSSNAITKDGQLVNIDRTGNRVAALAYGPGCVYVLCGRNKLVDGGVPQAIARIKRDACPPNARRLHCNTHCAVSNICSTSQCQDTLCNATFVMQHPTIGHPITVILIDADIGF